MSRGASRFGALLLLALIGAIPAGSGACSAITGLDRFELTSSAASTGADGPGGGGGGSTTSAGGGGQGGTGGNCACNPTNPCIEYTCNPDGTCTEMNKPAGDACGEGTCDGQGNCLGIACDPGNNPCANGVACVDGVCCESACDQVCEACNLPGALGRCVNVPDGLSDSDTCSQQSECGATGSSICLCSGGGTCQSSTKEPVGGPCTADGDCESNVCSMKFCRLPDDAPCGDNAACGTNYCDPAASTCKPCSGDFECLSGSCSSGHCDAVPGAPCGGPVACQTGATCTSIGLCKIAPGGACDEAQDIECFSNLCVGGTCTNCDAANQCETTTCNNSFTCNYPDGAYCTVDVDCESDNCTGFPLRCLPM